MKIGVIAAQIPPDPGGLGETVWAKHRWLSARGIDARVVTYAARRSPEGFDPLLFSPEITRYEPVARAGGSFTQKLRDASVMRQILQDRLGDCDLIEIQGWSLWAAALAVAPGTLAKVPWLMVFRGTDGWEHRPRKVFDTRRRVNRRAHTLANSRGLAAHLEGLGLRIDGHIWSEVDPVLFDLPAEEPEPGLIVCVKGLDKPGDPETLVRALAVLRARNVPFRYVHVGSGPLLEPMRRLCADLSLEKQARFLDQIPHAEVAAHLRRAAVKVLSSRQESCPHVIGEAMMMGRMIVATATTGASELIRHGETGLLAGVGDPGDLAGKIAQALADPEKSRATGRRAREWALANLHVDVVFRQYLELYERLLKG
ncbi:MAG: glycosyltransferase [Myxococcota bacterium]